MKNPNATVATGTSGAGVFVVWLLGNVFHWSLSAEAGAAIAGAVTAFALFFGRGGVSGLWNFVKNGSGSKKAAR